MGDTSSGKSSLLSALSGVTFPSSDQLTTRCPTQLILSRGPVFTGNVRLHRFHANESEAPTELGSMAEVPGAIESLTRRLVAEGQHISDDQIVIELRGPDLPNLTLTDLPGLVRTVNDHEDRSIIQRIRDMVQRFMKQERTIIIAVVPANVDMHNTEILQAAQEADPTGTRTIAVVTKVDLVDAGAEAAVHDLLLNKKKHMRLGYHAVKCRSQKDLNDGVGIEQGYQREHEFFKQHEYWRRLPASLWGIHRLTDRLMTILQDNIRRTMPTVVKELDERLDKVQAELSGLGAPMDSASDRRMAFGQWANAYLRHMTAAVHGEYESLPVVADQDGGPAAASVDLRLRAQLREHEDTFRTAIKETTRQLPNSRRKEGDAETKDEVESGDFIEVEMAGEWLTTRVVDITSRGDVLCAAVPGEWLGPQRWRRHPQGELRRFIAENRGDELNIFPSYRVFCNIFRQWVDLWEAPTKQLIARCRKLTATTSQHVVASLHVPERVGHYIQERVTSALRELCEGAEREMLQVLECERRPYTQDPALFVELDQLRLKAIRERLEELPKQAEGLVKVEDVVRYLAVMTAKNDDREAFELEWSLRAYVVVASTRFVDLVPMQLNELVLRGFLRRVERELLATTDERLARLLQESDVTQNRRRELGDEVACLKEAKEQIELTL